jgi:hypothetical protein
MLANANVPVRTAMELMRHTDTELTTGPYIDPNLLQKHEAVEALPAIGADRAEDEALPLQATGTHDAEPARQKAQRYAQRAGRVSAHHGSAAYVERNATATSDAARKSGNGGALCASTHSDSAVRNRGGGRRGKTWGTRIRT